MHPARANKSCRFMKTAPRPFLNGRDHVARGAKIYGMAPSYTAPERSLILPLRFWSSKPFLPAYSRPVTKPHEPVEHLLHIAIIIAPLISDFLDISI